MRKPFIALLTIALFAVAIITVASVQAAPLRIQQYLCYDRNPETGICGSVRTIWTHPDERGMQLHRPDTLRQVKAADLAYTALTGRTIYEQPVPDCQWGDPSCQGCYTIYHVIGDLWACDGACGTCGERAPKK